MGERRDDWDLFDEIKRIVESSMMLPFIFSTGRIPVRGEQVKSERPYYDVIETKDEVVLTLELPGVRKESIVISAGDDVIEVSVEASKPAGDVEGKHGGRYEGFHEAYKMPSEVKKDKVRAKYKNGVLEVRAQKADTRKRRKVDVV